MKQSFLFLFSFTGVIIVFSAFIFRSGLSSRKNKPHSVIPDHTLERLTSYAGRAKQFAIKNQFNNSIGLLIDMSIESGKNRFFVVDLKGDSVL
jgi:hypothetical protein